MKHLLFTALFFSGLVSSSCSGPQQLTVSSAQAPITVDGSLSGWNTTDALLKSNEHIDYYAAVNGNFLHLFVDVKSAYRDQMIRQMGLILYLSNSKDDRKNIGIAYPAGTFNLLRDYPGAFQSFTTDEEWGQKRENIELMEQLSEDLFSRIMIVERPGGSNNAEYGFVERSQLEIDGIEIIANRERRNFSLEFKIPLGNSSLFDLEKGDVWLGFAIEPPEFRFRNDETAYNSQRQGRYGQQRRAPVRRQSLPSEEDWFILQIN